MTPYEKATSWACDQVEEKIVDGKLGFPECTFADAVVQFSAGIEFVQPENAKSFYKISEELAAQFWHFSKDNCDFFDLCRNICAKNLIADAPLAIYLRFFTAQVLEEEVKRPTPSNRPRGRNWLEQFFLWSTIEEIARRFGLDRVRNDEPPTPRSACDAMAEALTLCGRETGYSELKNLMTGERKKRFRNEFLACVRIGQRQNIRGLDPDATAEARARETLTEILRTFPPSAGKSPDLT